MTPEALLEIGKVIGLPAAILLYMWMNRNPAPKDQGDPAKQLLAKLDAMEDRIIDLQAEVKVLLDRRKP
jgi:hypothetical protein